MSGPCLDCGAPAYVCNHGGGVSICTPCFVRRQGERWNQWRMGAIWTRYVLERDAGYISARAMTPEEG